MDSESPDKESPVDEPSTEPKAPPAYLELEHFLEALAGADASSFTPLTDWNQLKDAWLVEHDSKQWCGRFLVDVADPYTSGGAVERSFRSGGGEQRDFLRHRVRLEGGLELEVVEDISHLLVRVVSAEGAGLPGAGDAGWTRVERLLDMLLEREGTARGYTGQEKAYRWDFEAKGSLTEGVRFSTDSSQDMFNPESWAVRLDAGIQGGQLFFFGYKKVTPTDGRILFLDANHWFDGQAWAPYR